MNLKLNNDVRGSTILNRRKKSSTVKEERQRTGRYIAVLVGICLFMLAIYHAWVRRIPVVASLVVPALIMFVYVAWVLFTASRDKHRLQDLEAAHIAALEAENDVPISEISNNTVEISIVPTKEARDNEKHWEEISSALFRKPPKDDVIHFNKPIILINDRPPEDLDLRWMNIVEVVTANEKLKNYQTKKKFKRKFCRRKRYAAFKRSYSIA